MRLEISYAKTATKYWRINIIVLDREDFPTEKIFRDNYNYPTSDGFVLFPGKCNHIVNILQTKSMAVLWAEKQVGALRKQLNDWRNPAIKESHFQYI